MGICASCRGRRRKADATEREPLLPQTASATYSASTLALPPPRTNLDKAADVLAAVRTGKLPSQAQLVNALKTALGAQWLDPHALAAVTSSTQLLGGEGLSRSGRRVLADVREVIEAAQEWGVSKNSDDKLQDLVYETSQVEGPVVEADIAVSAEDSTALRAAVPSQEELLTDAQTLTTALRQLSSLFVTSSTFRLIFSDAFLTLRQLVADTAARTGTIATAVERVAGAAEEATRPGADGTAVLSERADAAVAEAGSILDETRERWERLARESPDRVREAAIGRIQNIVNRAQQAPEYRKAILSLLTLGRSYARRVQTAPSATPVIWPEPHLARALGDLRDIISRTANNRDMGPLLSAVLSFTQDIFTDQHPASRRWFSDVGGWFEKAIREPGFAISQDGTRQAEAFYDRAQKLFAARVDETASRTSLDANVVVNELVLLANGIASDEPTSRLTSAIAALSSSVPIFTVRAGATVSAEAARTAARVRTELIRDALGWALPRVLRALGAIPMPRVEFSSPTADAAIDALLLTAPTLPNEPANATASLVPDSILVQSWNELRVNLAPAEGEVGGVRSVSTVRVRIEGLRIGAHRVGYYVRYKGWLGYEDEGVVSLDVGKPGAKGQGLSADIELEFDTDPLEEEQDFMADQDAPAPPLFRVRSVATDVPGLALHIDKSKHWIINKGLLQPLVGPIGRGVVKLAAAGQLRNALERVAQLGGDVQRDVRRVRHERWHRGVEDADGWSDWWDAANRRMSAPPPADEQEEEGPEEEGPRAETSTSVVPTTKGVVVTMTTTEQGDSETSTALPDAQTQTQIAVGIGAQLLPGKGGPHGSHDANGVPPAEAAREVLDEVEEEVEARVVKVESEVEVVAERAEQARKEVEQAEIRARVQMKAERRRQGWRSKAFDL